MLSVDDFRLCEQVESDLAHIRNSWSGELSEHVIRRESPIIRRLLIDGDYSSAWRKLGFLRQPLVLAHDLEDMLGTIPKRYVRYAFPSPEQRSNPVGGDGHSIKMGIKDVVKGDLMIAVPPYANGQGAAFLVIPKADLEQVKSEDVSNEIAGKFQKSYLKPMWLTEFLDSAGAYVDGLRITRREVIDFVTNAMGGTHYDPEGRGSSKAARGMLKPLHVRWRGSSDVHAPWIEIMSIGNSVAWSTDARRLTTEFNCVSPPKDMPLGGEE